MRIREITIDRFGVLHSQRLPDIAPGVTVFLGDNEAGKSTSLDFLRGMLFGFPTSKKRISFLGSAQSATGGSLLLSSDTAGDIVLRRSLGVKGGPFTLTGLDGSPRPPEELARILRGCTADLYDKVFAFSLGELMHFSSLNDSSVRHALHGAAFGTGLRSPNKVLKELETAMSALFAPKATTSRIHRLLAELETLNASILERGDEVQRYATLYAERENSVTELETLRAERAAIERERRDLERQNALRRKWETLREAENALAALPETPGTFTPDGRERLDRLADRLQEREQARSAAHKALARAQQELAALSYDARLADALPAFTTLLERKESVRRNASALIALTRDQESLTREAARIAADLGPDWDENRLRGFDLSLAVQERCARLGQDLAHAHNAYAHAEREAERARRDHETATANLEEADRELHTLGALSPAPDATAPAPLSDTANDTGPDDAAADRLQHLLMRAGDAHEQTHALATALRNAEMALDESIATIDPEWTRRDLESLALLPADRERLLAASANALDADRDTNLAEREAEAARLPVEEAARRLQTMRQTFARECASLRSLAGESETDDTATSSDPVQMVHTLAARREKRRGLIRRALNARRTSDAAARTYAAANEQLGDIASLYSPSASGKAAPWGMALLFLGALIAAVGGGAAYLGMASGDTLGGYLGMAGFALGLVLAAAGFVFGGKGNAGPSPMEEHQRAIEQRLIRARLAAHNDMEEATALLEALTAEDPALFSGGSDPESLADAEAQLARMAENIAVLGKDARDIEREETALDALQNRANIAETRLAAQEAAQSQAHTAWANVLEEASLPTGTHPAEIRTVLEKIDAAATRRNTREARLRETRNAENALAECLTFARSFPALATRLASLPEPGSHMAPDPGAWLDEVRAFLTEWRNAGRERIRLRELRVQRALRARETESLLAAARAGLEKASATLRTAEAAWHAWLAEQGLPPALSPETARMALDAAAKGKTALEERDRLASRATAARDDMASFARDILENAGHIVLNMPPATAPDMAHPQAVLANPSAPDPAHVAGMLALLDDLAAQARRHEGIRTRHAEREQELPALVDTARMHDEQTAATERDIRDLLDLGQSASPEAYRATHSAWSRREQALTQKNTAFADLEADARDTGIALPDILASFDAHKPEETDERLTQLADTAASLREREEVLVETRGGLDMALQGLTDEHELAALLRKREELTAAIDALAREYARLALAKELLLTAKRRLETERQDGVAPHAGEIFRSVTGGAYSGLTLSLDDESVAAVTANGDVLDPETELSRGTREQLYLALRLAYIQDHGAQAEKLPVIMDDILVNFDAGRAANTAAAIAAFAKEHQVLFFTCHAATADMLCAAAAGSRCYTLSRGEFALRG